MPHVAQLLLLVAILVAAAKLTGAVACRLGQPPVFGEILAGVLLGPTLLDLLHLPLFGSPDGHGAAALLGSVRDLAELGVILLMFGAGLETNLAEMRRVGTVAFWAALGGVVLPLAGGAAVATAFGLPLWWQGVFIGTILTATSVSISAQTLIELNALRTREGSTILGAAVIDDVMGILVLSVVVAFARHPEGAHIADVAMVALRMAAFFAVALLAGRWFEPLVKGAERLRVQYGLPALVLAVVFVYAWAAEAIGQVAAITGAYLAGVLFSRTSAHGRIAGETHALTYALLAPVFFVSIGLQANARDLGGWAGFTAVLVLVAIVSKAAGCAAFARAAGFPARESLRVGVGMISRGEVGLIVAGYGLAQGLIGGEVFSAAVVMVLATTMVTPPLLRLMFPRQEGKEAAVGHPAQEA